MSRKLIALLCVFLLTFTLLAAPPAQAFSRACDQYATCHSPGDCAWWAIRCALDQPWEFMEITTPAYWDW